MRIASFVCLNHHDPDASAWGEPRISSAVPVSGSVCGIADAFTAASGNGSLPCWPLADSLGSASVASPDNGSDLIPAVGFPPVDFRPVAVMAALPDKERTCGPAGFMG